MGGLPYWCLVDDDSFVDILESFDSPMLSDSDSTSMEMVHDLVRQDVDDERRLPRS